MKIFFLEKKFDSTSASVCVAVSRRCSRSNELILSSCPLISSASIPSLQNNHGFMSR